MDDSTGRRYPSKLQHLRAHELRMLADSGEIGDLRDPGGRIHLAGDAYYATDFRYMERGRLVTDEPHETKSPRFDLIAQLWPALGDSLLRIVTRGTNKRGGLVVRREIAPDAEAARRLIKRLQEQWGGLL